MTKKKMIPLPQDSSQALADAIMDLVPRDGVDLFPAIFEEEITIRLEYSETRNRWQAVFEW
jgi:hypothetical protein